MKATRALDTATNVAVVVSAILFVALGIRYFSFTSNPPVSGAAAVYDPGDRIDPIPGLTYDQAERTVLLFLSSTCIYCTESMPFYRSLAEAQRDSPGLFRLVAVTKEDKNVMANYLGSHALTVDQITTVAADQPFRLRLTPTLVLVDRDGKATQSWVGALSEDNKAEVLRAIL